MFSWSWKKLWILLLVIPLLTACPTQPRLTLPSQAVQGESVTASLEGLNGEGARVTVAGLEATVTGATRDSITFTIPDNAPEGSQEVVILSGDGRATGKITIVAKQPGNQTFTLDRKKVARGEVVGATTTGVDLASAKVTVGGKPATIEPTQEGFTFKVPDDAPAGPQTVTLETSAGNLNQTLGILGDVVADKLTILLKTDVTQGQLQERLAQLGFTLEGFRTLGASDGPCASALADIDVNGKPLGQAIEELEKENVALYVDPRTAWASGAVDHLSAISASIARTNGFTGAGSTIAVLDTGVNEHSELTGRLVSPFNAIDGSTNVTDDFDDANVPTIPVDKQQPGVEGHGTPIAVLAAGTTSGVAPKASIMPIKAFGADGIGFSNDVIVGVCHALTSAPDLKKLVLNLSFGGDTPVDALEAILKYALDNGVQVAAAAGNEGESGSPPHYPAAYGLPEYKLDGLVAVGALQAASLQCVDFQSKTVNTRYDPSDPQAVPPVPPTTFEDNGRTITVEGFQRSTTSPPQIDGSFAVIEDERQGGGVVPDVQLATARLAFTFEAGLDGVTLRYGDFVRGNGGYNLAINNELNVFFGSLSDVNGTTLGGVNITAAQDLDGSGEPLPTGTLRLSGSVSSLMIGGTSLWLDDICPSKSSAWQPAVFSTRGDYVDISAPGAALRSGTPGGIYATAYEGTSFSTPLVAGAMALWKEAEVKLGALTPVDIEKRLKDNALPLSFPQDAVGTGLLNLNVEPFTSPLVPPIPLRAGN
jgi:subtilisin